MVKGKNKKSYKKDPNLPKRAVSAYFFYLSERRQTIAKEHPEYNNRTIISAMSAEWNRMNEKDKKKFVLLAEEDKKRYAKEKAEYEASQVV